MNAVGCVPSAAVPVSWGGVAQRLCLPRGVSARGVSAQVGYLPDTHTPCGQNHRQVQKHDLAATMLRTVINEANDRTISFQNNICNRQFVASNINKLFSN